MALKDRFRKAIGRDHQRSASVSTGSGGGSRTGTGGTTTPNHTDSPLTLTTTSTNNQHNGHALTKDAATHTGNNNTPAITLTKTHSKLTRSLTWGTFGSGNKENKPSKKELKERKAVEAWKREDADEWSAPAQSRPGRKNQKCQDTLRAFDFKQFEGDNGVRSGSVCSGISPSASRANSVADGDGLVRVLSGGRKRSSVGKGSLSQEIEVVNDGLSEKVKEQRMARVGE